jgi:hypothetical protein
VSDAADGTSVPEFPDVVAFVAVLNRHRVRYVVIGGSAAQFSVPSLITYDVDFTPATNPTTWSGSRPPSASYGLVSAPLLSPRASP